MKLINVVLLGANLGCAIGNAARGNSFLTALCALVAGGLLVQLVYGQLLDHAIAVADRATEVAERLRAEVEQ